MAETATVHVNMAAAATEFRTAMVFECHNNTNKHSPIMPTVTVNNYDILSQQQKWHNTATVFNGEGKSSNNSNSNSNNIDDSKGPAANQYFTRHE